MPHCIIEYAKDLEVTVAPNDLVKLVHQAVFSSELFEESSIKTRALAFEHYQTGLDGKSFIHVNIKILQGRNHKQKKLLSNMVLDKIKEVVKSPVSLTVEVFDIEKVSYSKTVT